ncbi:MAG TPA: hypothetical protein VGJ67_07450 [Actinomycetota bacterium]
MRARSILRGGFMLVLAIAIAGAPASELADSASHRGSESGFAPHVAAAHPAPALVGTANGTPDADRRPGDERDPAPPLPGSAAGALLLAGAIALAFFVVTTAGRLARVRRSDPHVPRAPPAISVTV